MIELLLMLALSQTAPVPTAKLAWEPVVLGANVTLSRYKMYLAPIVVDANGDKTCGNFRRVGQTTGLWMLVHVGGCYSVSAEVTEKALDLDTNLPISILSESPLSEPVVVEFGVS